jgi:hypothetical protein
VCVKFHYLPPQSCETFVFVHTVFYNLQLGSIERKKERKKERKEERKKERKKKEKKKR